jgi:hypothetical protein
MTSTSPDLQLLSRGDVLAEDEGEAYPLYVLKALTAEAKRSESATWTPPDPGMRTHVAEPLSMTKVTS